MKRRFLFFPFFALVFLFQNCGEITERSLNFVGGASPSNQEPSNEEDRLSRKLSKSLDVYIERALQKESFAHWSIADKLNGFIEAYKHSRHPGFLITAFEYLQKIQNIRSQNLNLLDFVHNKTVPALISDDYTCGHFYANLVQNMIVIEKGAYVLHELIKKKIVSGVELQKALSLVSQYEETFAHFSPQFKNSKNAYAYSDLERSKLLSCGDVVLTETHPLNMNTAAGLAHFWMYRLESLLGNQNLKLFHKARFVAIAQLVRETLTLSQEEGLSFYTWLYVEGGRVEDTNHALLTVNFMMNLYEYGWSFDKEFLRPLVGTFFFILNDGVQVRSHLSEGYGEKVSLSKYHRVLNAMSSLCLIDKEVYRVSEALALEYGEPTLYAKVAREKWKSMCGS